ncbi:MAG: xanthine dehydrogenase family protein molybdopterin-binding subunit, partial [Gemmatimonadales bacterium]
MGVVNNRARTVSWAMALPLRANEQLPAIGRSVPRREAPDKVTGRARYTDDLEFTDAWIGATVRSTVARARLNSIVFDTSFDWDRVAVATAADVPGDNVVHLIDDDQPALVADEIRHYAEPVVVLAAPNRNLLESALAHIHLEYEELEPVLDMEAATGELANITIEKGDVTAALARAEIVVERTFRMGHQEQLYIEPQAMVAVPNDDGVTIYGSLQCPYYVHRAVVRALALPAEYVTIVQAETGGAFGGKEEYPSMVAIHAALLARSAGRPVRFVYDRHEDLAATTKRHPGVIRHRTAVDADGELLAQDIDILLDGGAYSTLSGVVLSRCAIHAAGPYSCPNVSIKARAVATNTPPNGAFRGFGAPQSQFAAELMVEHVAQRLGVSSLELRRRWVLRPGDATATGQQLTESVSGELVLDAALRHAPPAEESSDETVKRGRGLALVYHGAGFTGSGEKYLAGRVAVECTEQGEFRVLTAQTEIGQGTNTILAQLAADGLQVPYEDVTIVPQDTSVVPDSGPTVASRTAMIVGNLVFEAAGELRRRLASESPPLCVEREYVQPRSIRWDEDNCTGDAYPTY